jgi:hypothetical protein
MGLAGLEGPYQKRAKTAIETRIITTRPDSRRFTT